jgi:Ca-activated chloride channel homolog
MISFHFIMPVWLWGILPLGLLGLILWFSDDAKNIWQRVCDRHLYVYLMKDNDEGPKHFPLIIFLLAVFFALIAMAGPSWKKLEMPVFKSDRAHMLVLDLSQSMNAKDISPSRAERAKYKIRDILAKLQDAEVGLVVFSGEAFLVSPLTQDTQTIEAMIPQLTQDILPVGGEDLAAGIDKALQLLQQAGEKRADIVVLTDASTTASAFDAAKRVKAAGYTLSILGMGTGALEPIPLSQGGFEKDAAGHITLHRFPAADLKALAEIGGGVYATFTEDDRDMNTVLKSDFSDYFMKKTQTQAVWSYFQDEGYWFILPILLLSLWGFRRGRFEKL